jgi:hypothetical protein
MTMPDDDQLPERLQAAARAYHAPGDTPREEMWRAIAAERARRTVARRGMRRLQWGLALAATLVLGIGIGRMIHWAGAPLPESRGSAAYTVAAGQYLARAEVLLTDFRAESRSGRLDPQFVAAARDLLTTTRLMLDSPAGEDQHLRPLLQDLELVLAQISQLRPESGQRSDLDLIKQSMSQSSVLTRLRAATPAADVPARTEGAS